MVRPAGGEEGGRLDSSRRRPPSMPPSARRERSSRRSSLQASIDAGRTGTTASSSTPRRRLGLGGERPVREMSRIEMSGPSYPGPIPCSRRGKRTRRSHRRRSLASVRPESAGRRGEMAAVRSLPRELEGIELDPEKRGAGEGKRERGQVGVEVAHLTSRRARGATAACAAWRQ